MSNVFKLRTIALAEETSFGDAPASGYSPVYLATDIEFSPKVETFDFKPLRKDFGEFDGFKQHTRSTSTLRFRIPIHGFLKDGDAYTSPQTHQLARLLEHCIGGYQLIPKSPGTPVSVGVSSKRTAVFDNDADLEDVSSIVASNPSGSDDSLYQGIHMFQSVESGGDRWGNLDGPWIDRDGSEIVQSASSDLYYSSTVYFDGNHSFPFTYTFELVGDDTNDAWIIRGCAGSVVISGEVNDLVWAEFSFNASSFTRTSRSSLIHTSGDAFPSPNLNDVGANPIPMINSSISRNSVATSKFIPLDINIIDPISFELDLGVSISKMTSLYSDEGIGYWYKESFSPVISIETYWDEQLENLFSLPEREHRIYINIGSEPGNTCCIFMRNVSLSQHPENGDGEGLKTTRITGKLSSGLFADRENVSGVQNQQADSLLKIAFL